MGAYSHSKKPVVRLFQDGTGISVPDTARQLSAIFLDKQVLFKRSAGLNQYDDGFIYTIGPNRTLKIVSPAQAASILAEHANITKKNSTGKLISAILRESDSRLIIESSVFYESIPGITCITRCPVLVEDEFGRLKMLNGYDRHSGIYACGSEPVLMDLDDAINLLFSLADDFDFKTPADRSRFVAHILSPAFVMGGLCGSLRAPIMYVEADESQAGKGYITKLIAAIYNDVPCVVNQQRGGLGSLEESINEALIAGYLFINIDNLVPTRKGEFNSVKICSMMTEDRYGTRAFKKKTLFLNPSRHIFQMTTNGCTISRDLVNRSAPIAIRKLHNHQFKVFPGGRDLVSHIRTNPTPFQSAVFTVIDEYYQRGRMRTSVTAHESSYTPWVQTFDYLIQDIFGLPSIMEGYEEVRNRIANMDLQMIREIALALKNSKKMKRGLTAMDIAETTLAARIQHPSIDLSIAHQEDAAKKIARQIGTVFSRCFEDAGNGNKLKLDGFLIDRKREAKRYEYEDHYTDKLTWYYTFEEIQG